MFPDCTRAKSDSAFRSSATRPASPVGPPFCAADTWCCAPTDAAVIPLAAADRASYGARIVRADTGHSPFVTHPAELMDILESLSG